MAEDKVKNIIDKTFQEVDSLIEEIQNRNNGRGDGKKDGRAGAPPADGEEKSGAGTGKRTGGDG